MKKFLLALLAFCLVAAMFVLFGSLGDKDKISAFGENTKNKNVVTIQSPTTNNRHTLQGRLNCKEGTYAMLEGCACV